MKAIGIKIQLDTMKMETKMIALGIYNNPLKKIFKV